MDFFIVTNNEAVRDRYSDMQPVWIEGTDRDVFIHVRNLIHTGHILLTHPLSGSLKPGETPFRSVLVSKNNSDTVDAFSLQLIEACLHALTKFRIRYEGLSERKRADFREVDLSLIDSAIPRAIADRSRSV